MQQTQQEKQQKIIIANTPVYQQLPMDRWMAYEKSFNKHKYKSNINNNNNNNNKNTTTTANIININNIIKLINTFSVYNNNNNKNHQHEQHNTFLIVLQTPQQRSQSQQHPRKITLTIINLNVNSLEYSLNSRQQQPYNNLQYLHCGQKQHQATTPQLSHNHNHHHFRSIEKTLLLPNNTITKSYNVLSTSTSPLSYNIKSIATLGLKSLSVTSFMAISIIVNKKNTIKNYEDFTKNLESILIQLFIELFLIYYNYLYLNLHRHRKSFRRKSSSYSFSKFPSLYHHCKSLVA